jgi:hypothetical protein
MSFFQSFLKNIIVLIVGGVFFGIGGYLIQDDLHHQAVDTKTIGYVTGIEKSTGSKGRTMYASRILFPTTDGQKIEFVDNMRSSSPSQHVGDQIRVMYDPANPHVARVNSLWRTWGFYGIFFFSGLAVFLVGIVRVARRQG